MSKNRGKAKRPPKEGGTGSAKGQIIKLRPGKAKDSWLKKLAVVKDWLISGRQFVREAIQELRKVTWPGRKETLGATAVVLFLVLVVSVFLGLVDFGLSRLVRQVIR